MMRCVFLLMVAAVAAMPAEDDAQRKLLDIEYHEEIDIEKVKSGSTVKCRDIAPEGEDRSSDNHLACRKHCRTLKKYKGGRCIVGMCRCGEDLVIRSKKDTDRETGKWIV